MGAVQLLFLDECTSGLDSFLAESLMRSLKQYASMDAGRIVVATIHQPSAAIFSSLDQIICLSRGHLAYVGPPDEVEAFLSALGHQPAAKVTPAEAMLSLVSSQEVVGKIRRGEWGPRLQEVGALPTGRHTHVEEPQILSAGRPRRLVSKQLAVLTWRAMVIMARSPTLVLMHCVLGFVVGIGMGVVYLDVSRVVPSPLLNPCRCSRMHLPNPAPPSQHGTRTGKPVSVSRP